MDPTKTTELNRFIEVGAASSGMRTSFLSEDTWTTKRSPNVFYSDDGVKKDITSLQPCSQATKTAWACEWGYQTQYNYSTTYLYMTV